MPRGPARGNDVQDLFIHLRRQLAGGDVGGDEPGADGVDAHACGRQFTRHGLGQAEDAGLGGRVVRAAEDAAAMVAWVEGMHAGILKHGGASLGDKTMIDAWAPAAEDARAALAGGGDLFACLDAAVAGAERGRDHTATLESRRGRSAKLGARSIGHVDPGAASAHVMLRAICRAAAQGAK